MPLLNEIAVSPIAVLVAAFVYYIWGFVWYSSILFGHQYRKETDKLEETSKSDLHLHSHHTHTPCVWAYVGEALIALIIAYFLAVLMQLTRVQALSEGILLALWLWFGFVVTTQFSSVLWANKTFKNFLIYAIFNLIGFILVVIALTLIS